MLSARQWAKLGEVVLNGGAPIVTAGSMAQSWRGSGANRAFSLGWWNNRQAPGGREFDIESTLIPKWTRQGWGGTVLCRNAPGDVVACIGSGYQRLYVIPSMNLVVVRHGRVKDESLANELITREQLKGQLRQCGVRSFAEVEEARIESDGKITVIPRNPPPAKSRRRRRPSP